MFHYSYFATHFQRNGANELWKYFNVFILTNFKRLDCCVVIALVGVHEREHLWVQYHYDRAGVVSVSAYVYLHMCVCVSVHICCVFVRVFFALICCFISMPCAGEFAVAFNRLNLNNLICHIIFIHTVNKL